MVYRAYLVLSVGLAGKEVAAFSVGLVVAVAAVSSRGLVLA